MKKTFGLLFMLTSFSTFAFDSGLSLKSCVAADVSEDQVSEVSHVLNDLQTNFKIFKNDHTEEHRVIVMAQNKKHTRASGKEYFILDQKLESILDSEELEAMGHNFQLTTIVECERFLK